MNDEQLILLNTTLKKNTLWEALDIRVILAEANQVIGTMPVDARTRQQAGYLHGGASVALAESLASLGTYLNIDPSTQDCFGTEISASHVRSRREGQVIGEATVLHKGRSQMVWEILIRDEARNVICISRCTVAIVDKREQ
jgi:1,4-dihydroxy-2-naphthoyl-CoA hydrolase